ncbi:MAG: proton-conducting transporter membrane subunit [Candidatus Limnocylindrales bacterium]
MSLLVLLPLLIPLAAAVLGLLAWGSVTAQRLVALVGSGGLLAVGIALLVAVERDGYLVVQVANWPAPAGITMVADLFSAILIVLTGVLAVAIVVYSTGSIDHGRERFAYYPLTMVLLAGVVGTFLTGDLFNLYVWFEVLLIASFVLLALGGERAQLEGALKYVALNLVASAVLLVTIGVIYGLTGTVNMADLAGRMADVDPRLAAGIAAMLLIAFGIKAALVPLFFWLPASYHTPPVAVSALFSGLLTKVGIYALVRVFTLVFADQAPDFQPLLLTVAALTMVIGVFGAVAQHEMRRLLSFHIISQIGYLVMGLALFTVSAMAGLIYFLVHVALAKSTLFLVAGTVKQLTGSFELSRTGGLWVLKPGLAALFGIAAMSLAGIPPFSGFLAKLALIEAGLEVDRVLIVLVALGVSLLTLYSMLKIWNAAFWKPLPTGLEDSGGVVAVTPEAAPDTRLKLALVAPMVLLVACSIGLAIAAGPAFDLVETAAVQLMEPAGYIEAVLGGAGR